MSDRVASTIQPSSAWSHRKRNLPSAWKAANGGEGAGTVSVSAAGRLSGGRTPVAPGV
eukprot:CAMPEP_0195640262 /NCGR_PEP_ID=MMETSP0815-20121206/26056_1 /TAXON_ID=97485 /ORGANISM="Prymnesium parvum, Strain Texoma1" /LENGTH=57 /DNA_ID=CAMNT_0040782921 /DNA_START=280 /DNA_END=450 /DNA_ORIENTATION=-